MTRRKQKLSFAKAKTAWLAWAAWGIIGGIFMFEDTQGGSGWFTGLMTIPFWVMFAIWPVLWWWIRRCGRLDSTFVEIDDDIMGDGKQARLVQKDGVRYMEAEALRTVFGIAKSLPTVQLPGGDEAFIRVDDVRQFASQSEALVAWLATVDSIAKP